jgi:hypothetical protein
MVDPFTVTSSFLNIESIIKAFSEKIDPDYVKILYSDLQKTISKKLPSLKTSLKELIAAFESESLTLILGAGVSVEYGLPNWETLLQKLLLTSFQGETSSNNDKPFVLAKLFTKLFSPNPLIAARYLRQHYGTELRESENDFESAVRTALYEQIKPDFQSDLFSEIVQLCVSPGKSPNLDSIISYNYDDILEYHLNSIEIEVPFKTISAVGVRPQPGQLPIYHVHGYLPRKGKLKPTNLVTLSEDTYHAQYSDIYSWNNIVQINKFRDCICLFIGLSLTDPNLRRLLDIANKQRGKPKAQHYAIRKKYDRNTIKEQLENIFKSNPDLFDEKARANLKFDETIEYLIRVIEKFETQDDNSFGINTIWVSDYAETPLILKAIREKNRDFKISSPIKANSADTKSSATG